MKRFLYIVYYWPPAGGVSVLRNLKFVKYFREYGWEPVVYAPEDANYPLTDPGTFNDVPQGLEVIKTKAREPFAIFNLLQGKKKDDKVQDVFLVRDKKPGMIHKLAVWVRGNFFIPDARALWIKPSVRYLKKYLAEHPVDAIISYGPPHTTHRIAYHLKKETGIPWIADFQDPWTQIDYFEKFMLTDRARRKHKEQEQEVLKTADKVVMVSPSWSRDLAALGGRSVDYIPFGYDEDDFRNVESLPRDKFRISHFGTLGLDRNPEELWKVLAELANSNPKFKNDLQIVLAGAIDYTVFDEIEKSGLKDNLWYERQMPKDQVIRGMVSADMLLLLLNKGFGDYNVLGRIPAKLFEYLGSQRPILAIGKKDSDVGQILRETKAGLTVEYTDTISLKDAVLKYYEAWKKDERLFTLEGIEKYNFRQLTGQMAELLNQIKK
jgi:glycosyltransferase involved in cell wall biosynthesis